MLVKNYSAEDSIKKWAFAFDVAAIAIMILSFLAAFIVLCINAEYLWWISLIVLGGGGILGLTLMFAFHMTWGFAEIIGNTKRTNNESAPVNVPANDELPDL